MPTSKKRSGNPAVRAQSEKNPYTPNVWGSGSADPFSDLVVPSGQMCLVRRPGVEALLKAGVLNDMDTFTQIVRKKHLEPNESGGESRSVGSEEIAELLEDPAKMDNVLHTIDRIVCYVVVKPEVWMTPNDVTNRQRGDHVYADQIDLADKMFILNYAVGGSRDLERFRRELNKSVGDLDAVEDAEGETVGALRDQG